MRIAVIGANGQLGSEVVRAARARGQTVVPLTGADCDVRDPVSLDAALLKIGRGDAVVNTAALHKLDACEADPAGAVAVNTVGAYNVARAAAQRGASAVYVSTDYVFDGSKRTPYVESDAPHPLSSYGASKLGGEAASALFPHHYVARASALFGVAGSSGKGGNFVETMLAQARAGTTPRVVEDIVTSPTSAADAAALVLELLEREAPPGIYHLSNAGACSWREFADAIFERCGLSVRAQPIRAAELPPGPRRPPYSALASEKLASLGLDARPWSEALDEYLRAKGHIA